jgi:hypothetical protein
MPSTADSPAQPPLPAAGTSGKLVIISILSVALLAAGTSWWFRYSSTHRAAEFWGPQVAQLIRDAPLVEFRQLSPPLESTLPTRESGQLVQHISGPEMINITAARGLVHLRNALVEDRSFAWPTVEPNSDDQWQWVLTFRDDSSRAGATILLSPEGDRVLSLEHPQRVASTEPIAKGLREMFAEFSAMPSQNADTTQAADSAAAGSPPDSER